MWFTDITQHRAADGWVYCCAVIDVFSRRVVGWSIADHIRTELVVDALEMARWQRRPGRARSCTPTAAPSTPPGCSATGCAKPACSGRWAGSPPRVDNALIESFWSTMQRELLDRHDWDSRAELASAIFEWIEGWYNPRRRHTSLGIPVPARVRRPFTPPPPARHDQHTRRVRRTGSGSAPTTVGASLQSLH